MNTGKTCLLFLSLCLLQPGRGSVETITYVYPGPLVLSSIKASEDKMQNQLLPIFERASNTAGFQVIVNYPEILRDISSLL